MLQINVALPNGHAELLSLLSSSTVEDMRKTAQRTLGKKCLRLITAKNRVLVDPDRTLEEAAIKDGECLTALVLQPQLAAATNAFALAITQSLPGVMKRLVVTVGQFKMGWVFFCTCGAFF